MTEFIAQVVQEGKRYRVAILPISRGGTSPYVAASWAEQDRQVFEADTRAAAEAFIGQMTPAFWTPTADIKPSAKPQKHSAKSRRSTR